MSTKFYDKENIKFDNQLQGINDRLNQIQSLYEGERAYLQMGGEAYKSHIINVNRRIASLLREENKWTGLAIFSGTAVGALVIWELVRSVGWVLKWVGNKMARQGKSSANPQQRRPHARSWNY